MIAEKENFEVFFDKLLLGLSGDHNWAFATRSLSVISVYGQLL